MASIQKRSSNRNWAKVRRVRAAVTLFTKLLRVKRMAGVVKLHCGIRHIGQRHV